MMRQERLTTCSLAVGMVTLLAAAAASAQEPAEAPATDGAIGPIAIWQRSIPTLRSLNIKDAFTAQNEWVLPALRDEDVCDRSSDPPINGRVYELAVHSAGNGTWTDLPDGGRLWTFTMRSPNAEALRLRFEPFNPPLGAELIIYNATDPAEARGPVGSERARAGLPYWTPTVFGNQVRIEYYIPPEIVTTNSSSGHLALTGAMQRFPYVEDDDGSRLACRLDVTCDPAWADDALAVAHYDYIRDSDLTSRVCSGAMLNRLPAFDGTPFFLTAAHCIDTVTEANSIEVFWLYQTPRRNDPAPSHSHSPQTVGSTLLALAPLPDLVLLGLSPDDIPGGLNWAGWDSGLVPDPTAGTEIHHPSGTAKSISYGVFEGIDEDEICGYAVTTYRFDLSDGGQEGGSSGAPIFDDALHRVRAVASCSETPGSTCDPGEDAWVGSLNAGYGFLSPFLSGGLDVWVDIGTGGVELGTEPEPWNTLIEGYFGVAGGGRVHIEAGTYPAINLSGVKSMELWAENGTVLIGG